jgi:hypothetical protein
MLDKTLGHKLYWNWARLHLAWTLLLVKPVAKGLFTLHKIGTEGLQIGLSTI